MELVDVEVSRITLAEESVLTALVLTEGSILTGFFPLADFSTLGVFFTFANFAALVVEGHLLVCG